MANSKRRYTDSNGNMFIPMNVEGGSWNENFITIPKLVILGISVGAGVFLIAWLKSRMAPVEAYLILVGTYLFLFQLIFRYIILEERFYYKMYQKLKESEVTTPKLFWGIASVDETIDGALLTYADGKVGAIIALDRDTITGKEPEFTEIHYDAISEFYKALITEGYSFVQMNIMEQAGNDPRLEELDKLTYKDDNDNIQKLMERQVGYIRSITQSTLYESDYILIYSKDINKADVILNDIVDAVYHILDGAFVGYRILRSNDIVELTKEGYGVKYFDHAEATLGVFKETQRGRSNVLNISGLVYDTGEEQKLSKESLNVINRLTSEVKKGALDISEVSLKETLKPIDGDYNFDGIDFGSLSEGFGWEGDPEVDSEDSVIEDNIDNPMQGEELIEFNGFDIEGDEDDEFIDF